MKAKQRGFTLLEVLTVVAIIAILGAVAVVGYQEYTARAKASEIVLQYDALRTGTLVKLSQSSVESCDKLASALNNSVPVNSQHVALGYDFVPAGGGFRPVLTVCAKASAQYPLAVKVARGVHDTMAKVGDAVSPGAQLLDSVVSFSLRLSDGERAVCKTAVSKSRTNCDAGTPAPTQVAAVQAPPPGQAPSLKPAAPVVAPPDPGQASAPGLAPMQAPSLKPPASAAVPQQIAQQTPQQRPGAASVPAAAASAPTGAQLRCTLVDISTGRPPVAGAEINRLVDTLHAGNPVHTLNYDPANPVPDKATGSTCVACGDLNKGTPCSDLDLVLAITVDCPDDKPYCQNRVVIPSPGVIQEYRGCISKADMTSAIANQSPPGHCTPNKFGTPQQAVGSTCNAYCAGDTCNADTAPASGFRVECK